MASLIYDSCLYDHLIGRISFGIDQFRAILVTDDYDPSKRKHTRRSDVIGEIRESGTYRSGGEFVRVDIENDLANDDQKIILGGLTFANATIRARGAVYFKHRGGVARDEELVAYIDFGENVISTAGPWSLGPSIIKFKNRD
jgi:hypothetical protein